MKDSRENRRGSFRVLKAVLSGAAKDRLGAALIQPGSSRYRVNEVAGVRVCAEGCNKGGTACGNTSLAIEILQGIFLCVEAVPCHI